jgi:hypothetical protein
MALILPCVCMRAHACRIQTHPQAINLYHPDLIMHLHGQVSTVPNITMLDLGFTLGAVWETYQAVSQLCD